MSAVYFFTCINLSSECVSASSVERSRRYARVFFICHVADVRASTPLAVAASAASMRVNTRSIAAALDRGMHIIKSAIHLPNASPRVLSTTAMRTRAHTEAAESAAGCRPSIVASHEVQ